jgi:chaperone modulatory protein CbpM
VDDREFCKVLRIERTVCTSWIERQWLSPLETEDKLRDFRDVDVARGRLILDLDRTMGVNEEGIDLIVHLIDQFYGLRLTLSELVTAINAQPEEVRRRILADAAAADPTDVVRRPVAQDPPRSA